MSFDKKVWQKKYDAKRYDNPVIREKRKAYSRWRKRALRNLLIFMKGGRCEKCGSTIRLELHEPNGNTDNHSSRRLTEMRDGKRPYQVLCYECHSQTPNFRKVRRCDIT